MKLFLYRCTDGENVINKVLTNELEIEIRLKNDVDVINPSIVLSKIAGVDFSIYNYAFMPELNRYYSLNGVEYINNKMIRLDFKCDVLESYKNDILASNARLQRNIKTGDFIDVAIDSSIIQSVSVYQSDKGLVDGEHTNILTTIGS